jgi:hypothetical protein
MILHLTHEQLCDVLLASSEPSPEGASDAAQDHLRGCLICAAELEALRSSLNLFRNASTSYAQQQFAPLSRHISIAPPHSYFSRPAYWAIATAAVLATVLLPFSLHRQVPSPAQPAAAMVSHQRSSESDEALLEGIDLDLSTDVPSPMQPLADPTAGTLPVQSISAQRKN